MRSSDPNRRSFPEGAGKQLSAGAIVAILAVSAYSFLTNEIEQTSDAGIQQVDLNQSGQLPAGASYANVTGKMQSAYLYVIEKESYGRTERATVYAPITGRQWTPNQPVAYIVALHHGYSTRQSPDGKTVEYSIDEDAALRPGGRRSQRRFQRMECPLP